MKQLVLLLAFVSLLDRGLAQQSSPVVEADGYDRRSLLGWTVRVSAHLLNGDKAQLDTALRLLEGQLAHIQKVVPAPAVQKLQRVTLWFSPEYAGCTARAEYHPGAAWLKENGRPAFVVKGVEFTNVSQFESECKRMPALALHELAHAYHDQVLGFQEPRWEAQYRRAHAAGIYDTVQRRDAKGRLSRAQAYGMTNAQEYFAELSEAYFSVNDFFPFNKDELLKHDPDAAKLLAELWNQP